MMDRGFTRPNVALSIFPADLIAHEYWKTLSPFAKRAVLLLTLLLKSHLSDIIDMPCGKKRKRHKMATHKRKKRLRKNRHKKK
jgi:hypothetical protein